MKFLLMNKNIKLALIEFNSQYNNIEKIYEIYDKEHCPLVFKNTIDNKYENNQKILNEWFKGRGIPSWRKDIENLLERLNINSPDELLNKSYGLSLSDQYWIKDEKQENLHWENINFFTNDFKYKGYLEASFSSSNTSEIIDLHSPNNTTDGMLQKAWIIEDGKRILVKGTYFQTRQEPLNEWLVSNICKRLDIDYCDYEIDIVDDKIVSKCKNFINENQEIITAYDILRSEKKDNNTSDFEHYINILEKNGIVNARKSVNDLFLIDYIVLNKDRHMRNFGVIRNVETLKWEKATPIFDTGECMECDKTLNNMNFYDGTGKFFYNTEKRFSDIIAYIDIKNYDFNKLKGLGESFKEKLLEYKLYTDMTDERIDKIIEGLEKRISFLEKM